MKNFKVTPNRLKIKAGWCVIKDLPILLKLQWYKYYNALMQAYIKNPKIKW